MFKSKKGLKKAEDTLVFAGKSVVWKVKSLFMNVKKSLKKDEKTSNLKVAHKFMKALGTLFVNFVFWPIYLKRHLAIEYMKTLTRRLSTMSFKSIKEDI